MGKSRDHGSQQLKLRVFSPIQGGLARGEECLSVTTDVSTASGVEDLATAPEDRAIYEAIAEHYFKSDR